MQRFLVIFGLLFFQQGFAQSVGDSVDILYAENPRTESLAEVVIVGGEVRNTEFSARNIERNAVSVVNVMSAKAIELSPDLTVANVIQRMSGVTIERNSSGDGQYAILRGMDKRFNYTLVNGVKIPSPDNKNRFVPLDIFPSELLDRLEVTKALTADMEGDGIGGAVNLVMKDAPERWQFNVNLSTGYNAQFFGRDYQSFKPSAINRQSPNELYGLKYEAQMKNFSTANLHLNEGRAPLNYAGGFSAGGRLFGQRLGVLLAGSYSDTYRGNSSDVYGATSGADGTQSITRRYFSNEQSRLGTHLKLDYRFSPRHKLMWYNAYMDFRNAQVREENGEKTQNYRLRWNHQTIFNSTLKGSHAFLRNDKLRADWSLAYGDAFNETPDNVQIAMIVLNNLTKIDQNNSTTRRWEHNSDRDKAAYGNVHYDIAPAFGGTLTLSTGGMFRNKQRGSYFNEYRFTPMYDTKPPVSQHEAIRGIDWNNFDEIKYGVAAFGNLSDPLNYDATEDIGAGYFSGKFIFRKWQVTAGIRAEHTQQGYDLKFPTEGAQNSGQQDYTDWLPSLHVKYGVHRNANLRFSYARAINRPSFFEIVPYNMIYEDYKEKGNPNLQHTVADNFDLRYEFFPKASEQMMLGVFYKKIKNPIETGIETSGQDVYYMPKNFGDASNYGLEADVIKYFGWLGVKVNYTFTHSAITTEKAELVANPNRDAETNTIIINVNQTRPLYGQAAHVVNAALLFRDAKRGWDAQIAYSYTSNRLAAVSHYLDQDLWQAGYSRVDVSIEKSFKMGLAVFAKASNLLDTPMIQYVHANKSDNAQAGIERKNGGRVDRKEYYGQNILIGVKFKL
ncbi:MAG: TonB-dependent receptor [Prevotellaceae bacterium]|jgi:outer membrane cobalamin receptor|nr:TonB-dependent receptor [Prevotellaceae bacterium]